MEQKIDGINVELDSMHLDKNSLVIMRIKDEQSDTADQLTTKLNTVTVEKLVTKLQHIILQKLNLVLPVVVLYKDELELQKLDGNVLKTLGLMNINDCVLKTFTCLKHAGVKFKDLTPEQEFELVHQLTSLIKDGARYGQH